MTNHTFSPSSALAGLLEPLSGGAELAPEQIEAAVAALVDENEPAAAKATFLRALRSKGETASEIAGFARALLKRAVDPQVDPAALPGPMIDVCGTGGDRLDLFNVSTTASFILAAGGAVVAKHGNRAISSRSGGADVLAALGVRLDLPPADLRRCLETVGIGFLFAPNYHPAFKSIAPVRRQLAAEGTSTIFNLLGPLLNPAKPAHQLIGVFDPALTAVFVEVLRLLGRRCVWAVHGAGGMDEFSILGDTRVSRWEATGILHDQGKLSSDFQLCLTSRLEAEVEHEMLGPHHAGLELGASVEELRGGDAQENARLLTGILAGEIGGARRDLVLLNAAAGFVVAGLAVDLAAGAALAREQIASGRALRKVGELRDFVGSA